MINKFTTALTVLALTSTLLVMNNAGASQTLESFDKTIFPDDC